VREEDSTGAARQPDCITGSRNRVPPPGNGSPSPGSLVGTQDLCLCLLPEVQVAEESNLGTVVGLFVEQDPDYLACCLHLAQVAGSRLQ